MNASKILSVVVTSMALAACAVDDSDNTVDRRALPADSTQTTGTPDVGDRCHVVGSSLTAGTMTNEGWCCGLAVCTDESNCGDDLGEVVSTCVDCTQHTCVPEKTSLELATGRNGTINVKPLSEE